MQRVRESAPSPSSMMSSLVLDAQDDEMDVDSGPVVADTAVPGTSDSGSYVLIAGEEPSAE